jgi:hypothetical protein
MNNIQKDMKMWLFRDLIRGHGRGVVIGLLLSFFMASLAFTACDNGDPEIDITVKSDYSQIVEAVRSANKSLTEKLSLIEAAMSRGFADSREAQELLQQAVGTLSGTLKEKLAAVETAVQGQTTSLETKLGLIEAAVSGGFADSKTQQELIQKAIESLSGTLDEKLAAVEAAVKNQTASLETKLVLIETVLKDGLADNQAEQELLRQAIGSLTGTLAERLQALETTMGSQSVSLAGKLELIAAAVDDKLAENNEALALVDQAVESLSGTIDEKLAAVAEALQSESTGLEAKLGLIEAAIREGFADDVAQQELILQAVKTLSGSTETKLAAIAGAVENQRTTLSSKLDLIETAVQEGLTDSQGKKQLIAMALQSLNGSAQEKLTAVDTAMTHQTDSLTTKLELIQTALDAGLADETAALGLLKTAITSLQGSVNDVAAVVFAIDTTLLADGTVGKALADIQAAVQGQHDYSAALDSIQYTLKLLAADRIAGHLFVEMGNGLKWAMMNLGATLPENYGDFFAWAETTTKNEYTIDTYKYIQKESIVGGYKLTKYSQESGKTTLEEEDDAAHQNWGATWRTPTKAEWEWLLNQDNCTWEWVTYNGVKGMMATSKVAGYEGNQLFFPAAGYFNDENPVGLVDTGVKGCYMSNSRASSEDYFDFLQIQEGEAALNTFKRWCGFSVRPVSY